MGFVKALASGQFADQWKEFLVPQPNVPATAAVFPAVKKGTDNGRGENTKGSENVITNGSKIVVPEGTALITVENGEITGFIAEPGEFEFKSNDPNSKSVFAGNFLSPLMQTGERLMYGGQAATQQLVFYVNLKEIPNNRFGTQSEIYWDDAFLGTQVGAITRGTYTLKIVDPLLFVKNFVPVKYLQPDAPVFDFADMENEAGSQLFNEVVGTLAAAFSNYTNDPSKGNRITKIQGDQIGFAQAMSQAVEDAYQWKSSRGLEIVKTAIQAIEYDEQTAQLYRDAQQDDREIRKAQRMGQAYSANMPGMMAAASGQAIQAAASNENGSMIGFMGMNFAQQNGAAMMGTVNNMPQQQPAVEPVQSQQPAQAEPAEQPTQEEPYAKLTEMKKLLDAGVINQEDFDAAKAKLLGL